MLPQPAFPGSPSQLNCMFDLPPTPATHPLLTSCFSVPQRDAATTRRTRFTLSTAGLIVASTSSSGWVDFIFTECIASVQALVPAHAVVFDVVGHGETHVSTAAHNLYSKCCIRLYNNSYIHCRDYAESSATCSSLCIMRAIDPRLSTMLSTFLYNPNVSSFTFFSIFSHSLQVFELQPVAAVVCRLYCCIRYTTSPPVHFSQQRLILLPQQTLTELEVLT